MSVKFKMQFENVQGYDCVLNFIFDDQDYAGDPVTIYGGSRPFVLSEFNQDLDLFKPIRPQQATMEVLASINGVRMEDFISDNDRDIKVRFDFGSYTGYWYGVLSQEDIVETWVATNHILLLRADEGLGAMKTIPLQTNVGQQLTGKFTPFQLIQYATTDTVRSFLNCYVFSGLFHDSMTTGGTQTGLDQCYIDARTFEQSPGEFEDSYTVLEKINRAFSQTLFMYQGQWWILRMEELFIPQASNLTGFQNNKPTIGNRATISARYMAEVGVDEDIKPIAPEMLKTIMKASKETRVNYEWEQYSQVVCNEAFDKGTYDRTEIVSGTNYDYWSVDDWTLYTYQTGVTLPVPSTKQFYRVVEYTDTFYDSYLVIEAETTSNASFLESCQVLVQAGDIVNISWQQQYPNVIAAPGTMEAAATVILFADDGTWYDMRETGRWLPASWPNQNINNIRRNVTSTDDGAWVSINVEAAEPVPKSGYILVQLRFERTIGTGFKWFKDLNVEIYTSMKAYRERNIIGDFDRYTIDKNVKQNREYQIFLDDGWHAYKGAIYEDDEETLTDNQWFRRRNSSERYGFKQQNAIANWFMNRRYKVRLECNFFGLMWDNSGTSTPIGLINTIKFVDDAPNKTFAIVNMKEIDFLSCTWSANLIEVWDESLDTSAIPGSTDVYDNDYYYE